MFHNTKRSLLFIVLIILGVFLISACSPAASEIDADVVETQQPAVEESDVNPDADVETLNDGAADDIANQETSKEDVLPAEATTVNANGLSDAEINSLVYMREEEKLAHDVYLALYDIWGVQIFKNIANSEQTHTDAVANLLNKFDIPDPGDASPAGEFVNQELQSLYNELIEMGSQSLGNALKVGAAVEEIDILDLKEDLEIVDEQSIREVYENLLSGSENHLRAFTSTLEKQTGEVYQPQYLSQDAYDKIVAGSVGRKGQSNGRQP